MSKKPLTPRAIKAVRAPALAPKRGVAVAKDDTSAQGERSEIEVAIASELAPAVAIALLATTDQTPNSPPPALECLAAGVSASEDDGKVRVQLVFENGAVLPVEMSKAAGDALTHGLANELGKQTEQPK